MENLSRGLLLVYAMRIQQGGLELDTVLTRRVLTPSGRPQPNKRSKAMTVRRFLILIVFVLVAGCSPTDKPSPVTATDQSTVVATEATMPTSAPTAEETLTTRQANDVVNGKELLSIADLGFGVFSCFEDACATGAFVSATTENGYYVVGRGGPDNVFVLRDDVLFKNSLEFDGIVYADGAQIYKSNVYTPVTYPVVIGDELDVRINVQGNMLVIEHNLPTLADPFTRVEWIPNGPKCFTGTAYIGAQKVQPSVVACIHDEVPAPYYFALQYDASTGDAHPVSVVLPKWNTDTQEWVFAP